jgi:hypothetical protein
MYMSPVRQLLLDPPLDFDWGLATPKLHKVLGTRDSGGFVGRWDWSPMMRMTVNGLEIGVVQPPVVCEHHMYNIAPDGLTVLSRDGEAEWIRNNGTGHPTRKPLPKSYSSSDRAYTFNAIKKEGTKRRGALMSEAEGAIFSYLLMNGYQFSDAQALLSAVKYEVDLYIDASKPQILTAVAALDPVAFPWLDNPGAFSVTEATPVRDGSPLSTTMVSPRVYLVGNGSDIPGILNIWT